MDVADIKTALDVSLERAADGNARDMVGQHMVAGNLTPKLQSSCTVRRYYLVT